MSNIIVNMCLSDDAAPKRLGNLKRSKKRFHKKTPSLDGKGFVGGKRKNNHTGGCSRPDQACSERLAPATPTQSERLQHADSAFHCGSLLSPSTHRPTSSTPLTPNGKKIHKKPKEPVNTKSLPTTLHHPTGPSTSTTSTAAVPTKYLALDCEMVGAGPKGHINQLARCSIVSYEGDVIYDKFINPSMPVTDYRTRWSGIRRSDLIRATPYSEARKEILRLLMGKVVIGHAIHNDFKVLGYSHPTALTRDTSRIPLLNLKAGFAENQCASLKRLTKAIFNRDIQTGKKGHSSVEDARATMELYKVVEEEWERRLTSTSQGR